ncbi:hypothetical protein [Saccharothrix longispora]|uniref:hypothetical protein n=1 Tax=Saccharothrix longispora TaxID=33920 RepID=UPI0028FDBA9D|nr:hypothetical protein [Saccharothrix longispora]MDU0292535.1 hypothetical protein [Saccharothrix longispora]
MLKRQAGRLLAAVVLGAALVSLPTGQAGAAGTTGIAACTWQKTLWELPEGAEAGEINGYDGGRYAVGNTGLDFFWGDGLVDPRATLWDNGRVVMRGAGQVPYFNDVNASGLVVGAMYLDQRFYAITVAHDGTMTNLPANPAWTSSWASWVNNRGDIIGWGTVGSAKSKMVVWPANAPGTYREVTMPDAHGVSLMDVDEQGRVIIGVSPGGSYILTPAGQWITLAAPGVKGVSVPRDIRDGRVVGRLDIAPNYGGAVAEWDPQGAVVRTIGRPAVEGISLGGNGTIAGYGFVGSSQRVMLWRDGVMVAQPIAAEFALTGLSDDERTIVGVEADRPAHYRCS